MAWIIAVAALGVVCLWLIASVAVGDLRLWRRQGHPDAPADPAESLSGAHSAAPGHLLGEWHGYPDGYVTPDHSAAPPDLGYWDLTDPIVVTRVVRYGGGYGWVCAEDCRTWLDVHRSPEPVVFDNVDSARHDLDYHTTHECSALEHSGGGASFGAIPGQQLYRREQEVYPFVPDDCEHLNGQIKLPGEDFGRCAHCGLPGMGER